MVTQNHLTLYLNIIIYVKVNVCEYTHTQKKFKY